MPIFPARRQTIVELIMRGEELAVTPLARRLGVSAETVRRDLRALEAEGLLRRVHGGATAAGAYARRPVAERIGMNAAVKAAIAQTALPLLAPRMALFLGASSTTLALARLLAAQGPALAVTTNMLDIADLLAGRCAVTVLGGTLRAETRSLGGPEMLEAMARRMFDLAVIGASAIDPERGAMGPSEVHAAIGRTVRRHAERLAVLADATKLGRGDHHVVVPAAGIDVLVTEQPPEAQFAAAMRANGTQLLWPGWAVAA